jgi:hypothetical protein
MYKTEQSNFDHRNRSGNHSTKASHRGVNLLGWEEPEEMKLEQERDCYVKKWKELQTKLLTFKKGHPERKRLGLEMLEVQNRINSLRPARQCKGIAEYVMDVLRDELKRFQWNELMRKAVERKEKQELINKGFSNEK